VTDVTDRAAELTAALEVGAPWLDPALVERAITAVERSVQRLELGAKHTVVALVGATGSGKSSLFNALASMEIAQVGPRRPLTAEPMACVWGEGGSQELLDWLEVPETRRITRESVLDADYQAPLHGLVLLDLPDHDSTEAIHRVEVDRLVTMVDLLVWVVDPQKYADDALHSGYLQRMVGHDSVMVVVLNQIDRLSADEAETCERDLRRLLDGDGLGLVPLLPVSATRGDGVDDLRTLLADVVQDRYAIAERIDADLRATTEAVLTGLAPAEPGDGEPPGADHLVDELAAAAGVPTVIDALAAEYRRRGWQRAGWPLLRWLRAIPFHRGGAGDAVTDQDLKLIRASLPPISAPAQRARVELAVDATIAASADVLPQRWADAVRESVTGPDGDLTAALDRQVAAVDLQLVVPPWWWLVAAVQYVLSLWAALGAVWLVVLGAGALIGSTVSDQSGPAGLPLPALLLVVGLISGAAIAGLTMWVLAVGARRRLVAAERELRAAIELVVHERVIVPIRVVLAQHRATRLALIGGIEPEPERVQWLSDADPADPADPESAGWADSMPSAETGAAHEPIVDVSDQQEPGMHAVVDVAARPESGSRQVAV
jgi:GTPase Era involved in 16S rRNA processing